jgi:hypothetical protein
VRSDLGAGAQVRGQDEQPLQEVFQTNLVYPQEKGETQIKFAPQNNRQRCV